MKKHFENRPHFIYCNRSKMHSDYQSVKEQSGIFAGDGGYTIDIAGHSHLEGGLVTSTRQAESQGLNRFKTGTLSYGDIANLLITAAAP